MNRSLLYPNKETYPQEGLYPAREMPLDNLITDRTQADVENRNAKAFIDYNDLNRVEKACKELAGYFGIKIQAKTDWIISDFRKDSEMERIRQNIIALRNAFYVLETTPDTPKKIRYQGIVEANNIEQILKDMYILWQSIDRGTQRLSFRFGTKQIGDRNA